MATISAMKEPQTGSFRFKKCIILSFKMFHIIREVQLAILLHDLN